MLKLPPGLPSGCRNGAGDCGVKVQEHSAQRMDCTASSADQNCLSSPFPVRRNSAGDRGAKSVAEALASNTSLIRLDLRGNSIGMVGCRLLGSTLREKNCALRVLTVSGNDMDESTLQV